MILLNILVLDVKGYSHYWTKGKFLQNVPLVLFLLLSFHTKYATLKNMAIPFLKKYRSYNTFSSSLQRFPSL